MPHVRVLAPLVAAALLSGCASTERVCVRGEDPVLLLTDDGRLEGGDCVPEDQEPPAGRVRYPPDLEPTLLRDQPEAQERFQERLDAGRR